ncbi:MFS transporter [Candidatus Hepatincolaceae symbiont of Richtersius coronifer]
MPILFLITVIDLIGIGIIFPLIPIIKLKYQLQGGELAYVVSIFALFSLIGNIVFGLLSDKYGRKALLCFPLFVVAVLYYYTGRAESFTTFLLLRGLTGFFCGNFSVAFASASDLSTPATKFKYMGIIGAAFSAGFVLGPALGGLLASTDATSGDVTLPFYAAAFLNLIAALLALFFFKETFLRPERLQLKKLTIKSQNLLAQIITTYSNKTILFFTFLTVCFSSITVGVQIYLGLWLNEQFSFSAKQLGLYWSLYSIILTITQLNINKLFKPKAAIVIGFLLFGAATISVLFINDILALIVLSVVMAFGMGIINPNITGNISLQGSKNQQGLIFGINQSASSLGRIIGPNILGFLYVINADLIWITVGIFCAFVALLTQIVMTQTHSLNKARVK